MKHKKTKIALAAAFVLGNISVHENNSVDFIEDGNTFTRISNVFANTYSWEFNSVKADVNPDSIVRCLDSWAHVPGSCGRGLDRFDYDFETSWDDDYDRGMTLMVVLQVAILLTVMD